MTETHTCSAPRESSPSPSAARTPRRLPERIHLLGAGGAGLSGAARLLIERGHLVTAHDRAPSAFTDRLCEDGLDVRLGESRAEDLPRDAELVVRSAAVPLDDPQVCEAVRRKLVVLKYAELLGRLCEVQRTLAVAGTHGKTTTSWMLHHVLRGLARESAPELRPGALVGGEDVRSGTNALPPGRDGWLTVEACEYDRSFLNLAPRGAIITNVEADHLDYFGSEQAVREAFARFADRVHPQGLLVIGRDVPDSVEQAASCEVWRIGREVRVDVVRETHGYFHLHVRGPGWKTGLIRLGVPGAFNVENAACALGLGLGLVALEERLAPATASENAAVSLREFVGVKRRFEHWGTVSGVEIVHDYAHHPTEVRATISAARRALPGRPLHVLFQPHQHSRTARFLDEFVSSFRGVESVVVADVYGARNHIDAQSAGAEELAAGLRASGVRAEAAGPLDASRALFESRLHGGEGALILGAGDVDTIRDDLLRNLALRGARRS